MKSHNDIQIGTLVSFGPTGVDYIKQILPHGFESYSLTFFKAIPAGFDLRAAAAPTKEVLASADSKVKPVISSLGIYGNPLEDEQTRGDWERCIDACELYGCNVVAGFAGCLQGKSVPEAIDRFKEVFLPLTKRAADKGVRIAFENCDMGGTWNNQTMNIAHSPEAWEMMFNAVPLDNIGLQWEPCHQMYSLIDPLPNLRKWIDKVFILHGKDATVMWDVVREKGIRGGETTVYHRMPGFGDTNWKDVISILRMNQFQGFIDIEGWHDPVYRDDLEMTGQVYALNYLKDCRGGCYIENPVT